MWTVGVKPPTVTTGVVKGKSDRLAALCAEPVQWRHEGELRWFGFTVATRWRCSSVS
jgi:hypothetical protein